MIDKRISYRFGGGYQGSSASSGPAGGASSGGNYGGNTGGNQGGGGGDGGAAARQAAAQRAMQATIAAAEREQAARNKEQAAQRSIEEAAQRAAEQQAKTKDRPTSFLGPEDIKQKKNVVEDPREAYISDQYMDKGITQEGGDGSVMESVYKEPDLRTEKEKEEDWERAQDWDLIKDLSDKGYDFNEIQSAVEKGLTQKAPTTSTRRQDLIDFGLKTIMPETGLEKSLLNRTKSFMPDTKTGIMGTLGNYFNPGKIATNFALNKMGLSWLNPALGIAKMFGFKNPLANIGTRYAGVPYKKGPVIDDRGGDQGQAPANVVQASIQEFTPDQMNMIKQRYSQLQEVIDSGTYQGRQLTPEEIKMLQEKSLEIQKIMEQYLVNPKDLGLARGGIASIYG